jgi:HD-like signal output (HDOD) protein
MILKWISRLFGSDAPPPAAPERGGEVLPPDLDTLAPAIPQATPRSDQELFADFYHWITGESEQLPGVHVDKIILEGLNRLLQNPEAAASLVPRVPAVIPQLLRSLRDESMSGAELARQISQDVVLVAEVVREANSPYYAPTAPVRNIEGAVMLLGQNGLRMLIARVAFRPIINQQAGYFAKLAAPAIWAQSEKCALAAGMLAGGGPSQFEAYLAGLIENVGLMVCFRLIDHLTSDTVLPQSDDFCRRLNVLARMLSTRIARLWEFPSTVIGAFELAGEHDAPPLARVLARADRVSKLRMLVDAARLPHEAPDLLALDADERRVFDKLKEQEPD